MTKLLVLLVGLAFGGVAQAQIKCWTTADGKRACGDTPPAGAKVTTVKVAPAPAAAAAKDAKDSKDAKKDAKKGPMTDAEKAKDYRERQAEAQKSAAKAEQKKQDDDAKKENCARSQEMLRSLESGQRIQRTDDKGERYIIDDEQREKETAKARALVKENCS